MPYIKMKRYGLHKRKWLECLTIVLIIFHCIKKIFLNNELDENSVVEDSSVTASDGKNYKTKIYNLDAIIAAGYMVNSKKQLNLEYGQPGY